MSEADLEQAAGLNPSSPEALAFISHPDSDSKSTERPWPFGLLIAPLAVLSNGILSGVLSYLLRRQGAGIGRSSEIISLLIHHPGNV
jgi:hypothetical protein